MLDNRPMRLAMARSDMRCDIVEDRLLEILDRFGRQRILLVGDFMLDRYLYGDAERISPESPVPVLRVVARENRLGGAGSVAACIAGLGARRIAAIGVIGQDDTGTQMLALLKEAGIDTEGLVAVEERPTTCKTRIVGLAQHRHRQQLLRIDEEQICPLPAAICRQMQDTVVAAVRSDEFDAVLVEDYNKGVITNDLMHELTAAARAVHIPVLVDPTSIDDYSRYRGATTITPNRVEFSGAIGKRLDKPEQMVPAAQDLIEQVGLEYLVITLDKEGSLLVGPQAAEQVPSRPRDVYDNTGAGDAVLAMLGMALSAGASPVEAVHLANVAGGLEVEKFGATPIRRDEVACDLLAELRKRGTKVYQRERMLIQLERHRRAGRKVVFTNGCFDLLHVGHVDLLRFCKQSGDVVVVGLNSDASVRQNKGPSRPVLSQQERASLLEAIEYVDYVVIFDEVDPHKLIEQIRPDVLVKGQDYTGKWVCGQEFVESYGGKVALAPLRTGYSTTNVIHRIGVNNGGNG